MSKSNELKAYLPSFYNRIRDFNELFDSEGVEIEGLNQDIIELLDQLFIEKSTWGLGRWEKDFKLTTDESKPLEERRSVIKSRKRGIGKVDSNLIKLRCDAYTNGDVEVSFNGAIVVKFTSVLGRPPNFNDLVEALEEIKPAHLRIEFEYKYLYIDEVHQTMTIDEINSRPLTDFAPFEPV